MNKLKNSIFTFLFIVILFVTTIILCEISLLLFNKFNQTKLFNCDDDCLFKKKELVKNTDYEKNFITLDRIDYFKKISKTEKENIVVTIPPVRNIFKEKEIYPLSGITNSKTIFCNELGFYVDYFSDKYGFNNLNKDYDRDIDFLLIGDSFTHGSCVKNEDNFKGNLIRLFNYRKNVLNLGYQGTGPLHQFGILKEYLEVINPKNVIQFYFEGNDLQEISEEMFQPQLKKYLLNKKYTQNLINNVKFTDQNLKLLLKKRYLEKNLDQQKIDKKNVFFKNLISILKLHQIRSYFRLKKIENKNLKDFSKIIKEIHSFLAENDTNYIFVYLPDYQRYKGNYDDDYKKYNQIVKIVKENNIKFIDIKKNIFDVHSDPLSLFPFKLSGHYNETGYKIVADYIYKELVK